MTAYATKEDLEAYWRTLTSDEAKRAEYLLGFAAVKIRSRLNGEPKDADAAKYVSLDMVKNAMTAAQDGAPITNFSQTGGPYSASVQYANPTGDLYWKKQYDADLGLAGMAHACMRARSNFDE